jgi:hypothetical protein
VAGIELWNNLNSSIKNSGSIQIFKSRVKNLFSEIDDTFPSSETDDIDRKHEKLINRLRSGLLLKSQKFRHNFANITPYCDCGQTRSASHLFFACHLNTVHRLELFESIHNNPEVVDRLAAMTKLLDKTNFLISGSRLISKQSNISLLKSVGKFLDSCSFLF